MWKYLIAAVGGIIIYLIIRFFIRIEKHKYNMYLEAGLIRPPKKMIKKVYEHVILFAEVRKNNICRTERRYDFSRYESDNIVGFQLLWDPILEISDDTNINGIVVDAELIELVDGRIIWIRK